MIPAFTAVLVALSSILVVPNLLALFILLAVSVLYAGGFAAEAWQRRRHRPALRALVMRLRADPERPLLPADLPPAYGLPRLAFAEPGADHTKLLDDLQLESEALLGRLQLVIRLGPMLGLIGTLVPLGPALMALSTGDVQSLSSRLVIAFSSTVIGLLVAGLCYALHNVRRRWYMQDLNDIEFVLRRLG